MNHFSADFSSSIGSAPAETPPRRALFFNPPDVASTTPIAPPPSTIFGSSKLGTASSKRLFQKSSGASSQAEPASQRRNQDQSNANPKSRLFQASYNTSIGSTYPTDVPDDFPEDDRFDEDMTSEPGLVGRASTNSLMKFSTNSPRKSLMRSTRRIPEQTASRLPRKGQPSLIPGLARDMGARTKAAGPEEDDTLVLDTEVIMQQFSDETRSEIMEDEPQVSIDSNVHDLLSFWKHYIGTGTDEDRESIIGPPVSASSLEKANYIATLLLTLRHPQNTNRSQQVATQRAILDWLEGHHLSYEPLYRSVTSHPINVTASELFWDAVLCLTLRGKLQEVMRLLAEADFKYAATSVDDGAEQPGYHGSQLQTIQGIIYRTRQILNASPMASGNWDTASDDWEIYRGYIQTELETMLQLVTEPLDEDEDTPSFDPRKAPMDLLGRQSHSARGLPLSIYQGLRTMFSILMGSSEEIIAQAQDWLEASCALTVWWDGSSDQKIARWSADVSRASSGGQANKESRDPYLDRLRDSFLCVTDPDSKESFPINTLSPVEVGVGCALQGSVQGVVVVLRTLSLCLTSAVVEVGAAARWLDESPSSPSGLNSSDLMVLSYGGGREDISKDDILQEYAISLFGRNDLRNPDGESIEGWELSLGILRRMDDAEMMHECVNDLLTQLDVSEQWRAEKVINLCTDLDLPQEARKISERFGDHLVNNTTSYGLALLCYAKSHSPHKIQQLTDLLISYCLVQSRAYPAEADMDAGLHSLVDTPKAAFADIAEIDPEAAAHLQFFMVGYACVRKFYTLRDAQSRATPSTLQPAARRRAAAKALIAAINSAADSIYGGLYDSSRQSAIQVDGLLTLLGEATALLAKDQETGTYNLEQLYSLLAAIEDLETVSEKVYAATDECLQAAIRNYAGSAPPSPRDMLKKSMSSGTNSNFSFSMMGSEMLARSAESGGKSIGSVVHVGGSGKEDGERGWDWRTAFKGKAVEGLGREVLKELRSGIAQEMSLRELDET